MGAPRYLKVCLMSMICSVAVLAATNSEPYVAVSTADDPVTCAAYANENDLLALEGWCRFRKLAKKDKGLARAIKQSKIRQVRRSQTYMFGYLIRRNYMEAMQFDSENKNSKWNDAIKLEMDSMREYKVFKKWNKAILDKHKKVMNPPIGYHRIKVHLEYAVKFDGRHKGQRYYNYKFSSGPFWTHKIKTKAKYISISNILHLLSAPASIPHVGEVLACLVVESQNNFKFSFISNFHLIVDLHFHPFRALTRSFDSFTPSTWMIFC